MAPPVRWAFMQALIPHSCLVPPPCSASLCYIGTVSISFTADGYSQLVAGRILTGMCIGIFSSTAPMFISELAPPAMRGRLGAVNQLCICIGIMVGLTCLPPHPAPSSTTAFFDHAVLASLLCAHPS
jgi:MFS family permease